MVRCVVLRNCCSRVLYWIGVIIVFSQAVAMELFLPHFVNFDVEFPEEYEYSL